MSDHQAYVDTRVNPPLPLGGGKYMSIPDDSELVRFYWLLAYPASNFYLEDS